MTFSEVYNIFTKVLDVAILWFIFYYILKYIKNNVKLTLIFKGLLVVIALKYLSVWLDLNTVGVLLEYVIQYAPLALVIIFQPEIRNILESLGRTQLLGRHKVLTGDEREKLVYEIMKAVEYLRRNRIGALIIIERNYGLNQYMENATKLYADISNELLVSIFFPNNPLHDGAVIIEGDKITCAGSVLPTSMNNQISKRLGTRHRAALGLSEITDAVSLVVSEETGRISIAIGGELNYNLTLEDARMMLLESLQPQKETFYEADSEEEIETLEEGQNEENKES